MSHASVLIALDKTEEGPPPIKELVAYQMAPFDENEECFRDGSRWDWWKIGGRYSGKFISQDIITVAQIKPDLMREYRRKKLGESWDAAMTEVSKSVTFPVDLIYGFSPAEISRADYV